MKTQSPTKPVAAKKAPTSSKKSPGTQPLKTAVTTRAHSDENVQDSSSSRSNDLQQEIAALAYKIWQEQGCPEGREEQHWRQAEQAVTRDALLAS